MTFPPSATEVIGGWTSSTIPSGVRKRRVLMVYSISASASASSITLSGEAALTSSVATSGSASGGLLSKFCLTTSIASGSVSSGRGMTSGRAFGSGRDVPGCSARSLPRSVTPGWSSPKRGLYGSAAGVCVSSVICAAGWPSIWPCIWLRISASIALRASISRL